MKTTHSNLFNKALFTTTVLVSMSFASGTFAQGKFKHYSSTDWAKVTHFEPITKMVEHRYPEQQCWMEDVVYNDSYSDSGYGDQSYSGTILGGVIGGAIGNAVGHKKKNKQIGAAVGAILGASIGHDLSKRHSEPSRSVVRHGTERRCKQVDHVTYEEEVVGYRVWYRYRGHSYKTRMDQKPGDKIKVRVTVKPV